MRIQYRYVDYGTTFRPVAGIRKPDNTKAPDALHENELALDVGGCCWGYEDCENAVIDHHFERPGQFPSASAGVLHLAKRIRERFRSRTFENFWLVSHREPDFDSFCSMYLARHVILADAEPPNWEARGLHPLAWRDIVVDETTKIPRISWFSPAPQYFGDVERWQILLAAVASCTDNAVSTYCPPNLALNSVLYAAGRRGRPYGGIDNGALEFFDSARHAIHHRKLNPLVDSIFSGNAEFEPELDLLTRDVAAYERDLRRARMAPVSVPMTAEGGFQAFYDRVVELPLLDAQDQLRIEHLAADCGYRQMDGIYIRDPESLLFRHWARRDTAHSSLGRGFTFTAIAYSGEMRDAPKNQTNYFFSLDPERAGGCHLYNVWALLEAAEITEILKPENSSFRALLEKLEHEAAAHYDVVEKQARTGDHGAAKQLEGIRRTRCRTHFEKRADKYTAFLDDPWFDGVNYRCTIVPAPNRGSLIGPSGSLADLTDDPVAKIVRRALEYGIYEGPETTIDYPASTASSEILHHQSSHLSAGDKIPALPDDHFRFGSVRLKGIQDLLQGELAEQIGRNLWPLLNVGEDAVPAGFVEHHLIKSMDAIGIWNRRGIFVAYRPGAECQFEQLREQFAKMADLARDLDEALEHSHHPPVAQDRNAARKSVNEAEQLLLRIADFEHDLVRTGSLLLHRMFSAIGVSQSLATVRDLHSATVERDQRQSTTTELVSLRITQEKIEWIEVLIVTLYATEIVHIVTDLLKAGSIWPARAVLLVAGAFGGLAYWGLVGSRSKVPVKERPHWALRAIPICVGILLVGLFVATCFWKPSEVETNKSVQETQSSPHAMPSPQPKQPPEETSK